MERKFYVGDFDRDIWAAELETFVPGEVFDAHTHIWSEEFATAATPESGMRYETGYDGMADFTGACLPGRKAGFLLMGIPLPHLRFEAYAEWCAAEAAKGPDCAFAVVVDPKMPPEILDGIVRRTGAHALKPYRLLAADPDRCDIRDYLPEALIEVADAHALVIVLHISKPGGIADPKNLSDLEELTRRYPRVTWQLAHCARAFNAATLEQSLPRLKAMDHICYDTSAVCDPFSHFLLFKHEDPSRILYGSDNILAGGPHGKYITFGRGWKNYVEEKELGYCDGRLTLICYEQLRAMRQAAVAAELSADALAAIFSGNARRLYLADRAP